MQEKIECFEQELKEFEGLKHVGNVRSKGLMAGIELVEDKEMKKPYELSKKMGWKIAEIAIQNEVLIRPLGNVVVLMPPLGIDTEDLKKLMKVTYRAIKGATES
jgi:adenosylmethionine-8-amino-7-oxononanoate aminotransferase